jgi:hypothetical protein
MSASNQTPPLARISASMIWPPQMTSRDVVLMAGHFSAVVGESQSTTNSATGLRRRFRLVKTAAGLAGKRCKK